MLDTVKIKALRTAAGLTQEQAAEKAGLAGRQKWSEVESGRATNITMVRLGVMAKVLGVKAKDLLK